MKVRHPDEKRIVETENLKETSLIKHMITVLTDEENLTRMVVLIVFIETSMYKNLVNDCVLKLKDHRSNRRS